MKRTIIYFFLSLVFTTHIYAQKPNAEIINYSTSIEVKNYKLHKKTTVTIQINNRAGEVFSEVEIPYSKLSPISNINAYITDRNGSKIRSLKNKDIVKKSAIQDFSFYEDQMVESFILKHNIYPYQIHYSYEENINQFIYVSYWIPVLGRKIPTRKASLTLIAPEEYPITYKSNLITELTEEHLYSKKTLTWKTSYAGNVSTEIYAPPQISLFPSVKIVPLSFKYENTGSFESWDSFGKWNYSLFEDLTELPKNEQEKITKLTDGINDPKEKIRILYHYLQDNTRYINVSIETGGLKPYPASYVARNKYGDCKALSNYFISVLDYAGIKAYYTKVDAGDEITHIQRDFPSQQFNHIILSVPNEKDTLWIDCTSDGPFGYLGTFTQNREVLVVDKEHSFFVKTPALKKEDVLCFREAHLTVDKENRLQAQFKNTYQGALFESFIQLSKMYNEAQRTRIINEYFSDGSFSLHSFDIKQEHRDSAKISFAYSGTSLDDFKTYGKESLLKVLPFQLPNFEKPEKRTQSVQIDYPIYQKDSLIYSIPPKYNVESVPKNKTIKSKFGEYSISVIQKEGKVIINKQFLLLPGKIPLTEYKAFHSFLMRIANEQKNSYIILI